MLKQFMDQLSSELQIADLLAPNEDQSYAFLLDPDLQISIKENVQFGTLSMSAKLAQFPQHLQEQFLLKTMQSNLFGQETGGGVLGLDQDGRMLIFTHIILSPLEYKEFRNALEDFANYAEAWREETLLFTANAVNEPG